MAAVRMAPAVLEQMTAVTVIHDSFYLPSCSPYTIWYDNILHHTCSEQTKIVLACV